MARYFRHPLPTPPAQAVQALRGALRERGITEYAVVDHGHDMAAAGAPGFTAWTVIFGNPDAGAELLEEDLAAAVDIPLRLAIILGEDGGSEIVARDMHTLLEDSDLADAFNGVLTSLAAELSGR